jgi:hypothetical protein
MEMGVHAEVFYSLLSFFLFYFGLVGWRLHLKIFILGKLYFPPQSFTQIAKSSSNFLLLKLAVYTKIRRPFRVLTKVYLRPGMWALDQG